MDGCQFRPWSPCARWPDDGIRRPISGCSSGPAEYHRLLGYPRGPRLDRARPRIGRLGAGVVRPATDGPGFMPAKPDSLRNRRTVRSASTASRSPAGVCSRRCEEAEAHSAILVAAGAGPEAEETPDRLWREEKPDEYFFLEVFGSAVVEHLSPPPVRVCAPGRKRGDGRAAALQPRLWEWDIAGTSRGCCADRRSGAHALPGSWKRWPPALCVPRNRNWAVFGLTHRTDRVCAWRI